MFWAQPMSKLVQYNCDNFPNLINASHNENIQSFKNGVNFSTETLKAFGNTLDNFYLSSQVLVCHTMTSTISQWVLCFGSTQNNWLQCFFFFFNKVHKIGWTPNIEGDKIWNNKSLSRDVQNKELPNAPKLK